MVVQCLQDQNGLASVKHKFVFDCYFEEPARRGTADRDVLSQLTTLRQQLKNEEKRVQQQMDRSTAVVCEIFTLVCHYLWNVLKFHDNPSNLLTL